MPARTAPSAPAPPRDPDIIKHYHAHIYYNPGSRERAARLRERVGEAFPDAILGRWRPGRDPQ